jgi:hypothetical protein
MVTRTEIAKAAAGATKEEAPEDGGALTGASGSLWGDLV